MTVFTMRIKTSKTINTKKEYLKKKRPYGRKEASVLVVWIDF